MPEPLPKECRDYVIRVVKNHDAELAQIAKDFGVPIGILGKWMRQACFDAGEQSGETKSESGKLGELHKRNSLFEQEVEVLCRATAYLSLAQAPG